MNRNILATLYQDSPGFFFSPNEREVPKKKEASKNDNNNATSHQVGLIKTCREENMVKRYDRCKSTEWDPPKPERRKKILLTRSPLKNRIIWQTKRTEKKDNPRPLKNASKN